MEEAGDPVAGRTAEGRRGKGGEQRVGAGAEIGWTIINYISAERLYDFFRDRRRKGSRSREQGLRGGDRERDREREKEREEEKKRAKEEEARNKDREEDRKKKGLPTVTFFMHSEGWGVYSPFLTDARWPHDCVQHHSLGGAPFQACPGGRFVGQLWHLRGGEDHMSFGAAQYNQNSL